MKVVKKFQFTDFQINELKEISEKYANYYNIYVVLGALINRIIVNNNSNRFWEDNEFTNFFEYFVFQQENDFIKDEYLKGRVFPLIPEVLTRARLFALNQFNFSREKEIDDTDVLMAHYLLLIIDHQIEKEKAPFSFDSKINYQIALHIEPIIISDDLKLENSYESLQICNYFFNNGEKDFSYMVYCALVLMNWAVEEPYIDVKNIYDSKFYIDPIILDDSPHNFANFWEYTFVLKHSRIYFPLGKFSLIYAEQYFKSLIARREKKKGNNPNDIISTLWNGRKEFMLERLIKKNKSAAFLEIYSENSIRKNEDIFSNKSKHNWMGKKAPFTPDFMIVTGNVWHVFDLKIIYIDSKYFSSKNYSYANTVNAHAESIRKLMNFTMDKDVEIQYFVSNSLVHLGEVLRTVIINDIADKFVDKYNEPIPKRIHLDYISLKRLEQWFGSEEMKLENLVLEIGRVNFLVPIADLLTDEMLEFYKSKVGIGFFD